MTRRGLRRIAGERRNDDRGFVAGADMLIFGVLAFVMGSLLIVNVWNVIDATFAVSAAAREGARVYQESEPSEALIDSTVRVSEVLDDYGRSDRAGVAVIVAPAGYERCAPFEVTASYEVALVRLPLFGQFGTLTEVTATHGGRIDAYRSGIENGGCQ